MKEIRKLFVSWVPETKGSQRTKYLANYLDFEIFRFPLFTRKVLLSPIKFPVQLAVTSFFLLKKRPKILAVEMVQPIVGFICLLYSLIFNRPLIVDLHSGPLISKKWAFLRPLTHFILKKSYLVILHEKTIMKKLPFKKKKRILLVHDPPLKIEKDIEPFKWEKNYLVFPSSGDTDEPLKELMEAAFLCPDIDIFITGKWRGWYEKPPENLKLSDFLPYKRFYSLLKGSKGIIALTKWDYTLLFAAFEAVNLEKPLIVSDKKTLRDFFKENAIYVDNKPDSIKKGIEELIKNYEYYSGKIKKFKKYYIKMWEKEIEDLKRRLSFLYKSF